MSRPDQVAFFATTRELVRAVEAGERAVGLTAKRASVVATEVMRAVARGWERARRSRSWTLGATKSRT